MSAPATRARRTIRAPPPTPIATGKGVRSAASNDRVLSEFLETSLRVPELTLPEPQFPPKSSFRVINLRSLVDGDPTSLRRMMRSASKIGAFLIDGWDHLGADEVRSAIKAARGVFEIGEEKMEEMGEWFGRGDEFYWGQNIGTEKEAVLERAFPDGGYRIFSVILISAGVKILAFRRKKKMGHSRTRTLKKLSCQVIEHYHSSMTPNSHTNTVLKEVAIVPSKRHHHKIARTRQKHLAKELWKERCGGWTSSTDEFAIKVNASRSTKEVVDICWL